MTDVRQLQSLTRETAAAAPVLTPAAPPASAFPFAPLGRAVAGQSLLGRRFLIVDGRRVWLDSPPADAMSDILTALSPSTNV
jgi:hypothetical protein